MMIDPYLRNVMVADRREHFIREPVATRLTAEAVARRRLERAHHRLERRVHRLERRARRLERRSRRLTERFIRLGLCPPAVA